jgi:acetolactate synthase-1/2/3 large subunit
MTTFPTLAQLGIARPAAPEPEGIKELARRLLQAKNPFVVVSGSGRDPATVAPLVTLCELLGLPVVSSISRSYHCFPMNHPLYLGNNQPITEADFVLVLDADVPWMPGSTAPRSDAYIAAIAPDPIKVQFPTYEFPAELRLTSDPYLAIAALTRAVEAELSVNDRSRAAQRAEKWGQASVAWWHALQLAARTRAKAKPIDNLWLGHQIGEFLQDDDIVIDETLFTNRCCDFVRLGRPGSYFANPGSSGGWSAGAALGAKFAAPERDVIALTGDGFYMFGTPASAIWAGARYKMPFMTVIYQNRSYSTGTARLNGAYPNAAVKRPEFDYVGGYFDPPINFAKEAEAAGAYGENVTDPGKIAGALKRGREHIRRGMPAVISVWLPKSLKTE